LPRTISTPMPPPHSESRSSSPDSLFDEPVPEIVAYRTPPSIQGLFFVPHALSSTLGTSVLSACLSTFFPPSTSANQIMLFGATTFPPFLNALLETLCSDLGDQLPPETHALLFPADRVAWGARQAIVNRYAPGEGITPHVDLLGRYGDGILGVSLGSSCAMVFEAAPLEDPTPPGRDLGKASSGGRLALYLPPLSVVVLSGDARYAWTHGIERITSDYVAAADVGSMNGCAETPAGEWVERAERLSITFRWLLPNALIVGQPD
jgi:hypothetical protein